MEARNNTREIGERVRTLRVQKGYSQEELARRLNLGSRSMVSEYESGKRSLSSEGVIDYATLFDVSADWILFGAGDKEKREYASEVDEMLQAFYSIRNPRARKIAIEQIRALSIL
jgi:transcriptional regulator with XRE-family HTH domain